MKELGSKYFVPSIEEIYVGYECEWQSKIRKESWHKEIFDTDLVNIFYNEVEHVDEDEPLDQQFRVPFLNRKQIEGEGWIFNSEADNLFLGKQQKFTKIADELPSYELTKFGTALLIQEVYPKMHNANGEEFEHKSNILFFGECKDINTFRWLCKLLKIE